MGHEIPAQGSGGGFVQRVELNQLFAPGDSTLSISRLDMLPHCF